MKISRDGFRGLGDGVRGKVKRKVERRVRK
jgi:hypothetical protein